MKLARQPKGSNLCGQACVATIAGVSLERSIAAFGKRGGTTTKEVIRALRHFGVTCADRLTRISKRPKPPLCMVVLHFEGAWQTHWAVYREGLYYDPACGVGNVYPAEVRETSFLPIYGKVLDDSEEKSCQ